ncbi:TonB family protein [Geomonas sp. Red32]|uniref:TonB family protein n=1 Tax=Geomonas sp. Red32 TaxID=2912856 RepID=UPI00202CF920|nr:TonB family protein [Geomonas sp. Red32]MCM0084009.1 TonB family protein [Geomonas sp. Red32]
MFAISFVLHLAVGLLMLFGDLLPIFQPQEQPVTYVDMVTLPVASPQSGMPAPATPEAPRTPAPPAPAAPKPPPAAMALPASKPTPTSKGKTAAPSANAKPQQTAPGETQEDARAFNDRIAKLERQAEDRRQAEVMARLRKTARTGMPGARGTQAGSDYASYIQSRLKDALTREMAKETRSPLLIAIITIGADGKVAEFRVTKPSGDRVFDDAVTRAVTLAGRSLKPPPSGQFRYELRFRPEEVTAK